MLLIVAAPLLACARRREGQRPALEALAPLELGSLCMARAIHAMHAYGSSEPTTTDEKKERERRLFADYYEAFLDAKEQRKYIACLTEDRRSRRSFPDWKQDYAQAKSWLRISEGHVSRLKKLQPKTRRIADVTESFYELDQITGGRRVTVTLSDGASEVFDTTFDTRPPQ